MRAVGDSPESASNQGINVKFVRYACILYGGAMCGLAGAYLSMIYTPQWIENMTGGRGWIALFLLSDMSSGITGANIPVDAGYGIVAY